MPSSEVKTNLRQVRRVLPLLRLLVKIKFAYLGPLRSTGQGAIPRTGGALLVANHRSFADPLVLQAMCPRHIRFMANREVFAESPLIARFLRWFGAFEVMPGTPDRSALHTAIQLVEAGEIVCVFPEGRLAEDQTLLPFLPGAFMIASRANSPVLLAGVVNTELVYPYMSKRARRARTKVWVHWDGLFSVPDGVKLAEVAEVFRTRVDSLANPKE